MPCDVGSYKIRLTLLFGFISQGNTILDNRIWVSVCVKVTDRQEKEKKYDATLISQTWAMVFWCMNKRRWGATRHRHIFAKWIWFPVAFLNNQEAIIQSKEPLVQLGGNNYYMYELNADLACCTCLKVGKKRREKWHCTGDYILLSSWDVPARSLFKYNLLTRSRFGLLDSSDRLKEGFGRKWAQL